MLWMILSAGCLASGNSLVRHIATELHPFLISFLSNLVMLLFVWPHLRSAGATGLRSEQRKLYALATVVGGISNLAWFYALANVPLAKATAITFAAPVMVTALAGGLLGERVSAARWLAVLTGFAGVLVIARPGYLTFDLATVALLVSTASMASMFLISKRLTQTETPRRIAAVLTAIPVATGLLPAMLFWRTPSLQAALALLLLATAMFAGRFTLLLALRSAPVSTVMPFDFARLPFVTMIAYFAYDERPDAWSLAGALLIMGAALFLFREEDRRQRRHVP